MTRGGEATRGPAAVAATVGIGVEALALAAAAVAYGIHAFSLAQPAFAVGLALFFGVIAAGLAAAARATWRGSRWQISAVLTWQALLTFAGASVVASRPALGIVALSLGVIVGALVAVAGRRAFTGVR